jgi:hypothetical protein
MAHASRILLSEFNAGHGTKFASRAAFYKAAGIIERRRAAPLDPWTASDGAAQSCVNVARWLA